MSDGKTEEPVLDEPSYTRGSRMAWSLMLQTCLKHLGYEDTEATRAKWITEREETIAVLRDLCGDFGDNDWDEHLHLADVVDKHLGRHLHDDAKGT